MSGSSTPTCTALGLIRSVGSILRGRGERGGGFLASQDGLDAVVPHVWSCFGLCLDLARHGGCMYLASQDGSDVGGVVPHGAAALPVAGQACVLHNVRACLRRTTAHLSSRACCLIHAAKPCTAMMLLN